MDAQQNTPSGWIVGRLHELKKDQKDLAKAIGVQPSTISRNLRSVETWKLTAQQWVKAAEFLKLPLISVIKRISADH